MPEVLVKAPFGDSEEVIAGVVDAGDVVVGGHVGMLSTDADDAVDALYPAPVRNRGRLLAVGPKQVGSAGRGLVAEG